ncbi:MAG: hypothetical protein R3C40_07595 [Parvularculaceae bacterium]
MFNFAFGVPPLVIFFSGLSALLWHWGCQFSFAAWRRFCLSGCFGIGGAVALVVSGEHVSGPDRIAATDPAVSIFQK